MNADEEKRMARHVEATFIAVDLATDLIGVLKWLGTFYVFPPHL